MIRIKRLLGAKSCAAMIFVLCCLCVLSLAPAVAAKSDGTQLLIPKVSEEYDEGMTLESENKLEKARRSYEFGKSKGCPWCMYRLGMMYVEGRGVRKDNSHGLKMIKRAAKRNHPDANYNLGEFYLAGRHDLKKNVEKGVELIRRAAELGQRDAIGRLGFFYMHGMYGVEKDREKALELLNAAIDKGDDIVAFILGTYYEDGKEVEQNFKTAVDYYEKAMFLGNKGAKDRIYNLVHLPNLVFGCHCPQFVRDYYDELNAEIEKIEEYYNEKNEPALQTVNEEYSIINCDADLRGKTGNVRGIVIDGAMDDEGNVLVTLLGPKRTYRSVKCVFDKDDLDDLSGLKKEDVINATGVFDSIKDGCVVVLHCRIVTKNNYF